MPEFRLNTSNSPGIRCLSKVEPFEVWMDEDGDACWHDGFGGVVRVDRESGLVGVMNCESKNVSVSRKLSDPIIIRW